MTALTKTEQMRRIAKDIHAAKTRLRDAKTRLQHAGQMQHQPPGLGIAYGNVANALHNLDEALRCVDPDIQEDVQ